MSFLYRMNRKYLLRYRLEYTLVVGVVTLLRAASPAFAWRVARAAGRMMWRVGVRRKTVLKNLAIAFPEMPAEKRAALGGRSYEHFASMCVDVLFQKRMLSRANLHEHVTWKGFAADYMREHGEEGLRRRSRGIIFLTGHIGNWELSSGVFGLLGVAISPVFRPPQNPWVANLLRDIRLDSQTDFIERRGAVNQMVEILENGGNIGFLFDQSAVRGPAIPFFGKAAPTHKTPALLALDHGFKIVFGVMVRRGDFLNYETRGVLLEPPENTGDRKADRHRVMTDLSLRLEAEVRKNPEQYLWGHRRWKRVGGQSEDTLP